MNERRQRVLRALINQYIASAQPVGSKSLVERYDLGCSPATVRNELSILEETGYVFQPHISAGRVPTDVGYRRFVDELLTEPAEDVSSDEESEIGELLAHAGEVDELLRETSTMLTRLTDYAAVVLAPTVSLARIKRIDLLSMAPRRALFVLIADSGRVVNRSIDMAEEVAPERLAEIERSLNASLVGKRAAEVRVVRNAIDASHPDDLLVARFVDEILGALSEEDQDRVVHAGVPVLLTQPEFADAEKIRRVISVLENGIAMLDALSDALASPDVTVRIGHENQLEDLGDVSIVATHYLSPSGDGVIGVVGPTRMDYNRAIGAVRHVARGISDALES